MRVQRTLWQIGRVLKGAGWAGAVGGLLLITMAILYWTHLSSLKAHNRIVEAQAAQSERLVQAIRTGRAAPVSGAGDIDRVRGFFPGMSSTSQVLRHLYRVAESEGLMLEGGEYKLSGDASSELLSYEMLLPVKGSYAAIRRFALAALNDVPNLAIQDLTFRRESIGSPAVEARVRFALYVRKGS